MKNNFWSKLKKEEGAIVIEATISLTTFMFLIFTILSIVNIVTLQAKIGIALNLTAKEISQYSYLYSMTGINGKQEEIHEGGEGAAQNMNDIIDGIEGVVGAVDSLKENGKEIIANPGGSVTNMSEITDLIQGDIDNGTDSAHLINAAFKEMANDPIAFILGVASILGNEGIEIFKNKMIVTPLTCAFIEKHLKNYEGQSAVEYLKSKGVVQSSGGDLGGLDFEESVLFHNGTSDIVLVADYTVSVIKFLDIDVTLRFKQKAWTKGWET